jgi:DegV family protein with EDD domain
MTRIVTDGAVDLPPSTGTAGNAALGDASDNRVIVVSGPVTFGEREWSGEPERFWSELGKGPDVPATRPPSSADLAAAYTANDDVLAVHVSSELSRTFAHAVEAAESTPARVDVVDSRSLSVGAGLAVQAASEAVSKGLKGDALRDLVDTTVDRVHVHAVIDDVDFLVRGGRAGLVAAKVDRRSHRHAYRHLIAVRGHVIPVRQVRNREDAIRELVEHVRDHVGGSSSRWAVGHGDAPDVDGFVERLVGVFGCEPVYVTLLGAAVGSHVGPRALLVGFLSDD